MAPWYRGRQYTSCSWPSPSVRLPSHAAASAASRVATAPISASPPSSAFLMSGVLSFILFGPSFSTGGPLSIRWRTFGRRVSNDIDGDQPGLPETQDATQAAQEPAAESLQGLKKDTVFRWVCFIFGGLLPGIKFVSLYGVNWSKAWGIMYVVSFLAIELLVVFYKVKQGTRSAQATQRRWTSSAPPARSALRTTSRPSAQEFWPYRAFNAALNPSRAATQTWENYYSTRSLQDALVFCEIFGILAQVVLLLWGIASLLDRMTSGFDDPPPTDGYWHISDRNQRIALDQSSFIFQVSMTGPISYFGIVYFLWTFHFKHRSLLLQGISGLFLGIPIFLGGIWGIIWAFSTLGEQMAHPVWWYSLCWVCTFAMVWLLHLAISATGRRWPRFNSYLALEAPGSAETGRKADSMAILALIFFLLHMFIPLFWYAFVYNPRWTYSPTGVGVFG